MVGLKHWKQKSCEVMSSIRNTENPFVNARKYSGAKGVATTEEEQSDTGEVLLWSGD